MTIDKLSEFASDGQKDVDDLVLTDGFPVTRKPARQWFNWLFNTLTSKINEIIDADFMPKSDVVDNLTTDDATKPVSAKQARLLQDNKLDKTANAASATNCGRSVVAGDGLSGGGELNANRTLTLGTPGTITASTGNTVDALSHTHNIDVNSLPLLGVGQSWQSMTASRVSGQTYTNNTGKPIQVVISVFSTANAESNVLNVGGVTLLDGDLGTAGMISIQSFVVPIGASYSFTTTTQIRSWSELR